MKAYYGTETKKALENFQVSGGKTDMRFIYSIVLVKKAASFANYKLGNLSLKLYKAILSTCDEVLKGKFDEQFVLDPIQGGAGTSINMNVNEVLATRSSEILGEKVEPIDQVNMSQSTNDVLPTAFRILCLSLLNDYIASLCKLQISFISKQKEFKDIVKVGRTHLQDAVPITLGQEFGAYASLVDRDIKRLKEIKKYLLTTNLGGTAIGTGINSSLKFVVLANKKLSELTGYEFRPSADLIDATQNTDVFLHLSSLLTTSSIGISKICNDLRLMASGPRAGFGEITLPNLQAGSSIMPNKNNPVILECYNQVSYQVVGNNQAIELAILNGSLELNVMMPLIIKDLIDSLTILISITFKLAEHVNRIIANRERCNELLDKSLITATSLNKIIGYGRAKRLVEKSLKNGGTIKEEVINEKLLSPKEIESTLSPKNLTHIKRR